MAAVNSMMEYGDPRLPERYWTKVSPEPNSGCWLWTASTDAKGYGRFGVGKKTPRAHRVAYEAMVDKIPDDLLIDHECRTPGCVNPRHLRACTRTQNQQYQRGRPGRCSRFKGVHWHKSIGRWRARIKANGKHLSLGCYLDEQEAARAYDAASAKYFGEFALTNEDLGLF